MTRIATRPDANGIARPAYLFAGERKKQSDYERPAQPPPPSWLARLLGRG